MKMEIKGSVLLDAIKGARSTGADEGLLNFKDGYWYMRCGGASGVLMFGARVGMESMNVYQRDGVDKLGIEFSPVENFITSRDDIIRFESDGSSIILDDGRDKAEIASIVDDYVEGADVDPPNVEHEVQFNSEVGFIGDFISKAEGVVGADWFFMTCREEGLYMYTERDQGRIDRFYKWDDFDEVNFDWEVNNTPPGSAAERKEKYATPVDDHQTDVILSSEMMDSLNDIGDEAQIRVGNHCPIKIIWQPEDGITYSYIVAPRIGGDNSLWTTPEDVYRA